jgi:O-antigen/teichoic acid export membrane protein
MVGASVLGVYFVTVALLSWMGIPGSAVATAMNKRVSEGDEKGAYIISGFLLNGAFFGLVSIVLVVFRDQVESYIGAPILFPFLVLLGGQFLFYHVNGGLNGQKKVAQAGLIQTAERVLRGIAQVLLVYASFSLLGLIMGHAFALILVGLFSYALYEVSLSLPRRKHFERLVGYARYSWLGSMKSRTFAWVDTIIMNFFVVSSLIGVYEIAWNIASIFVLINISLTQTVFPEMSNLSAEGDQSERIQELLKETITFSGLFVIPGFFGALVVGREILGIYGGEFTQGSVILLLLILARGVQSYGNAYTTAINGVNRPDVAFKINAALVITNVFLNVILIYLFSWYGAAVATLIASTVALLLSYGAVSRVIGKPEIPKHEILKQIGSASMMAVIVYLSTVWVGTDTVPRVVAIALFGATIYFALLFYFSDTIRRRLLSTIPDLKELRK